MIAASAPVTVAQVIPPVLKPSQFAQLVGVTQRTVCRWIEDGYLPASAVMRVGRSKHAKHIRLSVQRLREAGWLVTP